MQKFNIANFKNFDSPNDVFNWVNESYSQQELEMFDITKNLNSTLADYKCSSYQYINEIVRRGWQNYKSEYDIVDLQQQLLQKTLQNNIIVYRFVDFREALLIYWKTMFGRHMQYNQFLSTTMLKNDYAMQDIRTGRVTIKLYVPKGTPGMYLPEVNPSCPEYEVLFPYGLTLKRVGFFQYLLSKQSFQN